MPNFILGRLFFWGAFLMITASSAATMRLNLVHMDEMPVFRTHGFKITSHKPTNEMVRRLIALREQQDRGGSV
jgi:hypothetical protein